MSISEMLLNDPQLIDNSRQNIIKKTKQTKTASTISSEFFHFLLLCCGNFIFY